MIDDERDAVAAQFGVSTEQVERDHLISHPLAFLSTSVGERVQFIGGTALRAPIYRADDSARTST